jgi:hypothetical protein
MAPQPSDHSLEALSNLLYLIRRSLDDPPKTKTYLELTSRRSSHSAGSGRPGQIISEALEAMGRS